jgi:hypothetical protein
VCRCRRRFGQLLQAALPSLPGLPRNADLDDLLVGEQAQRTAGRQHRAPVEVRAGDGVHGAFGVALLARGGADGVGGLLQQQRLVAVERVQRLEAALQVRGQLAGASCMRGVLLWDGAHGWRAHPTGDGGL